MNIYDEALEIIEKRTEIGTMSMDYGHHVDDELHIDDSRELTLIEKALERAKKVEVLLKLKDKHISHLQSLYASTVNHNIKLVNQWSAEVQKIQSDIWKLEKELGEIK